MKSKDAVTPTRLRARLEAAKKTIEALAEEAMLAKATIARMAETNARAERLREQEAARSILRRFVDAVKQATLHDDMTLYAGTIATNGNTQNFITTMRDLRIFANAIEAIVFAEQKDEAAKPTTWRHVDKGKFRMEESP